VSLSLQPKHITQLKDGTMPRDLPLGNGSLLVAFDKHYQIRDLYWPYVGQENHALGHPFRLGVWVDRQFRWLDDSRWECKLRYLPETLVTDVALKHPDLGIVLRVADAVDFHENLLVRRFEVQNLAPQEKEVRLFFHHDFHIGGNEVGDTAYYEPDRRAVLHYKGARWFLINGAVDVDGNDPGPGWDATPDTHPGLVVGLHQWACGLKEIHNLEGTWKDAEDGELEGGSVAHGSVDSTVGLTVRVPGNGSRRYDQSPGAAARPRVILTARLRFLEALARKSSARFGQSSFPSGRTIQTQPAGNSHSNRQRRGHHRCQRFGHLFRGAGYL
jgi:glucoamylase